MDKDALQHIADGISDIFRTEFVYNNCREVPHYDDSNLTFEYGETKKGKKIKTCVLYADLRNSVKLSARYSEEIMGKIYTSFVKSVIWCAESHNGIVRNIIGDRVMVVFNIDHCFSNAVNCAISINCAINGILNRKKPDARCGIGIDYGEMSVIKSGIFKKSEESSTYKGLVWIGRPANIASRLTDIANKEIKEVYYDVTKKVENPKAFGQPIHGLFPFDQSFLRNFKRNSNEPLYLDIKENVRWTPEQFAANVHQLSDGKIFFTGGVISFEKKEDTIQNAPILMTKEVFKGYKDENPSLFPHEKYWVEQKVKVRDYNDKIFGENNFWHSLNEVNF